MNHRLAVAIRVLNCYTRFTNPSAEDVATLRGWVPSFLHEDPPDAWARAIIEGELARFRLRKPIGQTSRDGILKRA